MMELVGRFATSAERIEILNGLVEFRDRLRSIGITDGFQWLGGSFLENVELNRGCAPADIDLITFAYRPNKDPAMWSALFNNNIDVFDRAETKRTYKCDSYFVDLDKKGYLITLDTAYFNGLFSHQRVTSLWKCMVVVPLVSDDAAARQLL